MALARSRFARAGACLAVAACLLGRAAVAQDDSPAPLSLDAAVAIALENHPQLDIAAAVLREGRHLVSERKALRLPVVSMQNNYFRQGPVVPSFSTLAEPIVPPRRYSVAANVRQNIYDFGERAAATDEARRLLRASREELGQLRHDIELLVEASYYDVLRAQALVLVEAQRVAQAQEQLRIAQERFDQGTGARFDVFRFRTEVANAEQALIAAENDVELTKAGFNNALGRDLRQPVALESVAEPQPQQVDLMRALAAAAEARPLLDAERERIEAARAGVRVARTGNRPTIDFAAAYQKKNVTGFSPDHDWNAGLIMTFPFMDSGLTRSRVLQASDRVAQARGRLEDTRQAVELEVREAHLDMGEAAALIGAAQVELADAGETLRVANARYELGVGVYLEVIDGQVAVARAATNLANAQYDYLVGVSRLERATGVPLAALDPTPAPARIARRSNAAPTR